MLEIEHISCFKNENIGSSYLKQKVSNQNENIDLLKFDSVIFLSVLSMALFALRAIRHERTNFSPAELIHGKNLRLPQTLVYENWMKEEEVSQNVVDYILELNE